jgi:GntR family transcriptional regulator, transcriptional repressor for pyruvate dehydrogenase complex
MIVRQSVKPPFRPVRSGRLFERVLEQLRSAIFSGEFGPGEKLPSERELVASFGVSRASVREALRVLELSGVVVVRHGSAGGFFVAETPPVPLKFALDALMESQRIHIRELFDAKIFFEERVAEEAASLITDDDLAKLKANIEECDHLLSLGKSTKLLSTEFHVILTHVLGNPVLDELIAGLVGFVDGLERRAPQRRDFNQAIIDEHRVILAALASRRPRKAGAAMVSHLRTIETLFLKERRPGVPRLERAHTKKTAGVP